MKVVVGIVFIPVAFIFVIFARASVGLVSSGAPALVVALGAIVSTMFGMMLLICLLVLLLKPPCLTDSGVVKASLAPSYGKGHRFCSYPAIRDAAIGEDGAYVRLKINKQNGETFQAFFWDPAREVPRILVQKGVSILGDRYGATKNS